MKNIILIKWSAAAMVMAALTGSQALAQYQVTTLASAITENFNGLTTTATAVAFNAGLGSTTQSQRNSAWTLNTSVTFNVGNDTGTNTAGGYRSYGNNATNPDRALGFAPNANFGGTANSAFATAQFQNVSGSTVTSLLLGYTGEQFLSQYGRASFFTVSYSTTSATAGFTVISSLNFNAISVPASNAANLGSVNGDASGFRTSITPVNVSGLNVSNGSSVWVRWNFDRGTGTNAGQGLAIDDISLTFNGSIASNNSKFTVDGTSVATATTATVDLGKVFTNGSFTAGSATVTKSGSDAGTFTATGAGVTVTPTSGSATGSATSSLSVNLTASTATSGTKTGTVTVANTTANATDADDTITVNGTVLDRASVTGNNSSALTSGDTATLTNASGANRATAKITGTSFSGNTGFGVTGLTGGTTIAAGSNASGTITFTGGLNGATYTGSLIVSLEHADQTITGATSNDITGVTFNLTKTVSGTSSTTGSATLSNGSTYNGIGLTNSANAGSASHTLTSGLGSTASFLGGTASGTQTLSITFSATSTAANNNDRASDVADITAPGLFVLQLDYDKVLAQAFGGGESSAFLAWRSGTSFILATLGNTGNNAIAAQLGYAGSFTAFQGTYGTDLTQYIGAYGVDTATNTVWAVLNHNSEFTVVPEPTTHAMLFAGLLMLVYVVRRRTKLS